MPNAKIIIEPNIREIVALKYVLLKPKLAKFKQPKYYIFVEELPRNAMGKIQKASLREQFKEVFKS